MEPPEKGGWVRLFAVTSVAVARTEHPVFRKANPQSADALGGRLVLSAHGNRPELGEFGWRKWAEVLSLSRPAPSSTITVSAEHVAVDLVLSEEAFALVNQLNAGHLIEEGRLHALPGSAVATGRSYWARSGDTDNGPDIAARKFLGWVQALAAAIDHGLLPKKARRLPKGTMLADALANISAARPRRASLPVKYPGTPLTQALVMPKMTIPCKRAAATNAGSAAS